MFSAIPNGGVGPPLVYGVVIGTLALLFAVLWQMFFELPFVLALRTEAGLPPTNTAFHVRLMMAGPLLAAIGLFAAAGISHLVLMMLDDGGRGFGVTLRAVAYANTPQLLGVIPVCGGLVGGIWCVVLYVAAATEAHETEWWRALLTYSLPAILCGSVTVAWSMTPLFMLGSLFAPNE